MPYIPFTEDEKRQAGEVSLETFLPADSLKRVGREYRWIYTDYTGTHDSISIRGNEWYDHKNQEGGGPISFLQKQLNYSYQEAVLTLLGRRAERPSPRPCDTPRETVPEKPAEFRLPEANHNMRRVYAYLIKQRHIVPAIISHFAHERTLYESCEFLGDPPMEIHNAVFVGRDKDGTPRHAHKRSLNTFGTSYKGNMDGSDPACSFCHIGTSDRLFVFEAPIDLLSFLTLHPEGWEAHSYVALCGVSEHAMLSRLRDNPHLRTVVLCLDNDVGGIDATDRLVDILRENGYGQLGRIRSTYKDFNEDLVALHGGTPKPAVPHVYKELFMEQMDGLSYRPCTHLERTRARLWALYKDYQETGDLASVKRAAEHAASGIGLIQARLGRAADGQAGFEAFRTAYRRQYRAYKDKGKMTARQDSFRRAVAEVMRDLQPAAVRSPEEYEATADKLAVAFDRAVKLYAGGVMERMEQAEVPAQEQRMA